MAKVIAVCNQKGGVGKTTTAINLSAYLALSGKKVLLIDSDPQGNATSGLAIDKKSIGSSIYNVLLDQLSPKDTILPSQVENLSIIPSNVNLTGAEIELVGSIGREYKLKKSLEQVRDDFDFIIIDCPPSLGLLTVNALTAADSAIIPIQCEYYALEGLSQLINTVRLVKENLNPGISIEGVLLTMADFRTNLTNEVINEVKSSFNTLARSALNEDRGRVFETIIPRNIRLTEAPGFGQPIAVYDKYSAGALKYEEFANELLGVKKDIVETKGSQGEDNSTAAEVRAIKGFEQQSESIQSSDNLSTNHENNGGVIA